MPSGRRGTVTGVKQSGVAVGLWVGGVVLPVAALSLGWRAAMAVVGAATAIALVVTAVVVPRERSDTGRQSAPTGNLTLNADLVALTVFAFLLGFANSALAFMPLYAQEILDLSPVLSGGSVAMVGLAGGVGRVVWAHLADRHRQFERILQWQAVGGAVSFGLILTAPYGAGPWQLGIGALLMGFTSTSWNSVGMLAIITRSEFSRAGRESGVLMFGFMLGLGIGPPIQGWSVDLTGRYDIMWSLSLGLALIGFAVMASRTRRRS